ncbi:MAG: ABC transporter permease [Planctomycetota bacterium]|nr:ABC transporter permease [Planctomycetota bacterium]
MSSNIGSLAMDSSLSVRLVKSLTKYFNIFKVSLVERLAYRADFLLGTFLRLLPLVTTLLLWKAVYANKDEISGYTYRQVVAYLLLVHVSRMFSSMPGLASGIARDVRDGNLKRYLVQPLDLISYLLAYRMAHKVAYIITSIPLYSVIFFLCRDFFDAPPDPCWFCLYATALLMSFILGFAFEASLGMLGFWFLEISSFLYLVNTVNFFVSGHFLPLDLLDPWVAGILKVLPMQFMAYFPAALIMGKAGDWNDVVWGLGIEAAWCLGFLAMARGAYALGLRRYGGYGG